jgi:hypothetical protein
MTEFSPAPDQSSAGGQLYREKSWELSFRIVFWKLLCVVAMAALVWLGSESHVDLQQRFFRGQLF